MIEYSEYTSQDRKILTWDKENYDEFIASFTNRELEEMNWYLNNHPFFPIDCDYDEEERAGCLVCDYARRWLYEQIESGTTCGTRDLFEVVMALT